MKRGELYWASLVPRSGSEQQGRRPVVTISNDGFNEVPTRRSIIVIPVSRSPRQAQRGPSMVLLPAAETGLPENSWAVCHQITTLDRSKITTRIGALSGDLIGKLEAGIAAACDISC